ncbi:MAG: NADH-quinone oxidoreductase subunit C [Acidimicrobiales bacterium]
MPGTDQARVEVSNQLRRSLGTALLGEDLAKGDLCVRVANPAWVKTARECQSRLGFDYFCFLSGIDWMPHTWPNPKVVAGEEVAAEPDAAASAIVTGVAGGDTRFQVLARLYSIKRRVGLTLKCDLDSDDPRVGTWTGVYPGANWCERETAEMYGFVFEGHPNPVKLYLPGEFEGYPLRKDFALLSREVKPWPGLVDVEPFPPGTVDE